MKNYFWCITEPYLNLPGWLSLFYSFFAKKKCDKHEITSRLHYRDVLNAIMTSHRKKYMRKSIKTAKILGFATGRINPKNFLKFLNRQISVLCVIPPKENFHIQEIWTFIFIILNKVQKFACSKICSFYRFLCDKTKQYWKFHYE